VTFFLLFITSGAYSQSLHASTLLSVVGPAWANSGPALFLSFSFSFSARAKEILENYRKMLKIQDQFC
jgi:hypothetical protein